MKVGGECQRQSGAGNRNLVIIIVIGNSRSYRYMMSIIYEALMFELADTLAREKHIVSIHIKLERHTDS